MYSNNYLAGTATYGKPIYKPGNPHHNVNLNRNTQHKKSKPTTSCRFYEATWIQKSISAIYSLTLVQGSRQKTKFPIYIGKNPKTGS